MKPKTTVIRQKAIIPAATSQVYEAFVDSKKHTEFTGSKATGKPIVGNKFTAWDGYIMGKYIEIEKGKRLVQEWMTTDWPHGYAPSKLELTFTDRGEDTEVALLQHDIPVEQADELKQGWIDFYWEPLKNYFKKQKPLRK